MSLDLDPTEKVEKLEPLEVKLITESKPIPELLDGSPTDDAEYIDLKISQKEIEE